MSRLEVGKAYEYKDGWIFIVVRDASEERVDVLSLNDCRSLGLAGSLTSVFHGSLVAMFAEELA